MWPMHAPFNGCAHKRHVAIHNEARGHLAIHSEARGHLAIHNDARALHGTCVVACMLHDVNEDRILRWPCMSP
jgi:hypothetical protein